jgi:hypothetical protein
MSGTNSIIFLFRIGARQIAVALRKSSKEKGWNLVCGGEEAEVVRFKSPGLAGTHGTRVRNNSKL